MAAQMERDDHTGLLRKLAGIGAAAQAAIAGTYAWSLTVAPAAWAKGAPLSAKFIALAGLAALFAGVAIERRSLRASQVTGVWGLLLTSAVVWLLVPSALSPVHLDSTRGMAGMVGWGLFALASAAPALRPLSRTGIRGTPGALRPRVAIPRGDLAFIVGGVVLALGLEWYGWQVAVPERAILVRLVAVGGGVLVIGAATSIALARHAPRVPFPPQRRIRRAAPWLAFAVVILTGGAFFALLR